MIPVKDTSVVSCRAIIGGCLSSCILLVVGLVLLLISGALLAPQTRRMVIPDSVTIDLPDDRGKLEFFRIRIHPIASEYSRSVTLNGGVKHPLPVNTGWETHVNLYWIADGDKRFLRLVDPSGEYLLNINADKLMLVLTSSDRGRVFAGEFSSEAPRARGFEPRGDRSAAKAWVDDVPARPIEEVVEDREGIFIGSINGASDQLRFWGPSERAERHIDAMQR